MTYVFANNAETLLADNIDAVATTLQLPSGEGAKFPDPGAGEEFPVTLEDSVSTIEICLCTSRSGDVLTVVRGQEGTTAVPFGVGSNVAQRVTADVLTRGQLAKYSFYDNIGTSYGSADVQGALDETDVILNNLLGVAHTHGNKAVLDAITSAGSGFIITTLERDKLAGIEPEAKDDQTAAEVSFDPQGDIVATNVQAAIEELDTEKMPIAAALGDLSDVNLGSEADDDVLQFKGASWINNPLGMVQITASGALFGGMPFYDDVAERFIVADILRGVRTPEGEYGIAFWSDTGDPSVDPAIGGFGVVKPQLLLGLPVFGVDTVGTVGLVGQAHRIIDPNTSANEGKYIRLGNNGVLEYVDLNVSETTWSDTDGADHLLNAITPTDIGLSVTVNEAIGLGTGYVNIQCWGGTQNRVQTFTFEVLINGTPQPTTYDRPVSTTQQFISIQSTLDGALLATDTVTVEVTASDIGGNSQPSILGLSADVSFFEVIRRTGGGAGALTFLELLDTPANYTTAANQPVKVNAGESALEYVSQWQWDASGHFLPTTGSTYNIGGLGARIATGYFGALDVGGTVQALALYRADAETLSIGTLDSGRISFVTDNSVRWDILVGGTFSPSGDNIYDLGSTATRINTTYTRLIYANAFNATFGSSLVLQTPDASSIQFNTDNTTRWAILSGGGFRPQVHDAYAFGTTGIRISHMWSVDLTTTNTPAVDSDARFKVDIEHMGPVTSLFNQVQFRSFRREDDKVGRLKRVGVMAQELEKVFPDLVRKDGDGNLSVDYHGIAVYAAAALQEAFARITKLEEATQ